MDRALKPSVIWLEQAVKHGAVGLLYTALDRGLYFLLTHWIGLVAEFSRSISSGPAS